MNEPSEATLLRRQLVLAAVIAALGLLVGAIAIATEATLLLIPAAVAVWGAWAVVSAARVSAEISSHPAIRSASAASNAFTMYVSLESADPESKSMVPVFAVSLTASTAVMAILVTMQFAEWNKRSSNAVATPSGYKDGGTIVATNDDYNDAGRSSQIASPGVSTVPVAVPPWLRDGGFAPDSRHWFRMHCLGSFGWPKPGRVPPSVEDCFRHALPNEALLFDTFPDTQRAVVEFRLIEDARFFLGPDEERWPETRRQLDNEASQLESEIRQAAAACAGTVPTDVTVDCHADYWPW